MTATHCIRVLGRDLQVKSSSAPEYVAQVEALVNDKVAEATGSVSGGDHQVVAILAMMNLAEAFLAAKRELEEERTICSERVASLIGRFDRQAL